jgi:hypothetical protein
MNRGLQTSSCRKIRQERTFTERYPHRCSEVTYYTTQAENFPPFWNVHISLSCLLHYATLAFMPIFSDTNVGLLMRVNTRCWKCNGNIVFTLSEFSNYFPSHCIEKSRHTIKSLMEAADLHNYYLLGCHVCGHTARYQRFAGRSLV